MTRRSRIRVLLLLTGLLIVPGAGWSQQGDPVRGEALFVGSASFAAGGAPCLACHGIAGHELGYAGGASYGPDLTDLFEDYGEDGVAAVLEDPSAFVSMEPIFAGRPLNEDEIADLTAFFASVTNNEKTDIGAGLAGHVFLAIVLLLAVFAAFGWQRLKGVRRPLVDQARFGKGGAA